MTYEAGSLIAEKRCRITFLPLRRNPIDAIFEEVTVRYSVSRRAIKGPSRDAFLAHARQELYLILRERLNMSYPAIGRVVGGRDHATIMHGCKKAAQRRQEQEQCNY